MKDEELKELSDLYAGLSDFHKSAIGMMLTAKTFFLAASVKSEVDEEATTKTPDAVAFQVNNEMLFHLLYQLLRSVERKDNDMAEGVKKFLGCWLAEKGMTYIVDVLNIAGSLIQGPEHDKEIN